MPKVGVSPVWGLSNQNIMVNKRPHSRAINTNLRDAEVLETVPTVQRTRDEVEYDMAVGNMAGEWRNN